MKRPRFLFRGVPILLALCVLLALSLPVCAADPAEGTSPDGPPAGGIGREFPYLLGTGILLGMFLAVRLRRKADRDPTRR